MRRKNPIQVIRGFDPTRSEIIERGRAALGNKMAEIAQSLIDPESGRECRVHIKGERSLLVIIQS
jgi:hypothetical protein